MGLQVHCPVQMEKERTATVRRLLDGALQNCENMTTEQLIKMLYPTVPTRALCEYLGMNTSQLYNHVYRLGVKKSALTRYVQNKKAILKAGSKTRFEKGHEPHNKAKKMPPSVYVKVGGTMWKPGNKPHNTREEHATSIRVHKRDGKPYHYTKIRDGLWKLTHRVLWEQVHGEIPAGHVVRFKDGNSLHLSILNLECIPMKENMVKNTIQRYPMELQQLMKLKSKLNKTIKNHGKKPNE